MLESFFVKLQAFSLQVFIKETPMQVLSCEVLLRVAILWNI